MTRELLFWVVYLLWILLDVYFAWPTPQAIGARVPLYVLIGLLGWTVFGAMVR